MVKVTKNKAQQKKIVLHWNKQKLEYLTFSSEAFLAK